MIHMVQCTDLTDHVHLAVEISPPSGAPELLCDLQDRPDLEVDQTDDQLRRNRGKLKKKQDNEFLFWSLVS